MWCYSEAVRAPSLRPALPEPPSPVCRCQSHRALLPTLTLSAQTCFVRNASTPWEMSSLHTGPSVALGGIFEISSKNPWAAANVAYVPYCSSDAWIGDIGASDATFGWAFRGQRILASVLASLVHTQGLGSQKGVEFAAQSQRLLLSGCSAGARGAMMNLDYVSGILAENGLPSDRVEVSGLLDSPLWVDIEPAAPSITSLMNETMAVLALVNATARLGPGCADAIAGEEWKCLFGQYRMPFLLAPYLLNAAQDDKFELPYNLAGTTAAGYLPANWHPSQLAYANAFGPQVLAVVNSLPTASQKRSGVFSTACFRHCVTDSAAFWNVAISQPASNRSGRHSLPPISLRDTASEWYFGRAPQPLRIVQQCEGFRCGDCSTKLAKSLLRSSPPSGKKGSANAVMLTERSRKKVVLSASIAVVATVFAAGCLLAMAGQYSSKQLMSDRTAEAPVRVRSITSLRDKGSRGFVRPGARYGERSPLLSND